MLEGETMRFIRYLFLSLVMFSTTALAESSSLNLAIPSAPNSYMSDRFRAGDLDCSNAIGSATHLEFGVTGLINENNNPYDLNSMNDSSIDTGVYARIVIPLGARPKSRINCDNLYQLELRKKQLEVMRLEQELKQLRELQFAN